MRPEAVIETQGLTKIYNGQAAVDQLSFKVNEGEIFGFLGPNGAGKTTTLLMLLGLTEPSSGQARVLGLDPTREPIKVKAKIGYLQENMGFYGDLNARQMLRFVAELNGFSGKAAEQGMDEALETVGLLDEANKKIAFYSRGMRQRLGIAELLIKESQVAFLDEPTLGLDPDATNRMIDLICSLCRQQNITVLLSSHQLHQVQKICDRIGIMIKGRMVAQGAMDQLAKPQFIFLMLFTSSGALFSLVQFVAFFGPLVGLILGFDTINRERNEGTLSKLLSQPIYRDTVINGKFLAGVTMISVMMVSIVLVITGLGLIIVGIVPGVEELWRIFIYLMISIIYISFWLGIAILFSIIFHSTATSALASLAVWIFFSFFVSIGANILANALTPEAGANNPDELLWRAKAVKAFTLSSPMELYTDATATIIDPMRKSARSIVTMGPLESLSMSRFSGPLSLSQSILIVVPFMISLVAITIICFAVSYTVFMRQEIRSL
jgi:ABC-type multidrug transport system ATPase subunit